MRKQNIPKFCFLSILSIFFFVAIYGFLIEPSRLVFKDAFIEDFGLAKVLGGKTVLFLSDIHFDKWGKKEDNLLKTICSIDPDIILLGGDYVMWKRGYPSAFRFISKLRAKLGIWAVIGDYDISNSRSSCLFCHERGKPLLTQMHKITFLRSEWVRVSTDAGVFWIGGTDPYPHDGQNKAWPKLPNGGKEPIILLSHNPLIFDRIKRNKDILVLAGDTHGGQVPLPHWFWKLIGYRKNAKYERGFFQEGLKKMFVTSGVGTSHLPFRFLRPPEIVRLHFVDPLNHSR